MEVVLPPSVRDRWFALSLNANRIRVSGKCIKYNFEAGLSVVKPEPSNDIQDILIQFTIVFKAIIKIKLTER